MQIVDRSVTDQVTERREADQTGYEEYKRPRLQEAYDGAHFLARFLTLDPLREALLRRRVLSSVALPDFVSLSVQRQASRSQLATDCPGLPDPDSSGSARPFQSHCLRIRQQSRWLRRV